MVQVLLSKIAKAINAKLIGTDKLTDYSLCFDTRSLKKNTLFFALKGDNADGHSFVDKAFNLEASACIVSTPVKTEGTQLLVHNTKEALLKYGEFCRAQLTARVIGVTGSCGKTSVKEMLSEILKLCAPTLISYGNYNNDIGVPFSLSQFNSKDEFAVIEIGTNAPGEIDMLAKIVKPHVAIITNADAAHLEKLKTVELVAKEKGAIINHTPHQKGFVILNMDSTFFKYWSQKAKECSVKVLSFSVNNESADVYASNIKHKSNGISFVLHTPSKNQNKNNINLAFYGVHQVANALAVTAACLALKIPTNLIYEGLQNAYPCKRRGRHYTGINNCHIIDESYNANPPSVRASIDLLATYHGKKIMILGDMAELGR